MGVRTRECFEPAIDKGAIEITAVARRMGAEEAAGESEVFRGSFALASGLLFSVARPQAVVAVVESAVFAEVYEGEGKNDRDTPLQHVFPRADALALFVLTLGQGVSDAIARLFSEHDYLGGTLLDTMASLAAEDLVEGLERRFGDSIGNRGEQSASPAVLAYSPGYCGWHVSGQKALFSTLAPEDIGVTLSESCMMRPLKSVSGVMVAGGADIHQFDPVFGCCARCVHRECRDRIGRVNLEDEAGREVAWTCSNG